MSSHALQCCLSCLASLCHTSSLRSQQNSVYTSLPGLSPCTFHSYLGMSWLPDWAIRSLWINPKPVHFTHHWQYKSLTQAGTKEILSLICRMFSNAILIKNTYLLFSKLMEVEMRLPRKPLCSKVLCKYQPGVSGHKWCQFALKKTRRSISYNL